MFTGCKGWVTTAFSVMLMGAQLMHRSRTLQISVSSEPIILLLGIEPKKVNNITGKGLWTMKFIIRLYSRSLLNNLHLPDELSIPKERCTDEAHDSWNLGSWLTPSRGPASSAPITLYEKRKGVSDSSWTGSCCLSLFLSLDNLTSTIWYRKDQTWVQKCFCSFKLSWR